MSNHKQLKVLRRPRAAAAIGVLAVPLLGGVGYAAANSVSDDPKPQMVIPASMSRSAGDLATHDVRDDRAGQATTLTTAPRASDDNPATDDVGDDHGGLAQAGLTDTGGGGGGNSRSSGGDSASSGGHDDPQPHH
jgi:hypothetical protein